MILKGRYHHAESSSLYFTFPDFRPADVPAGQEDRAACGNGLPGHWPASRALLSRTVKNGRNRLSYYEGCKCNEYPS